MQQINWQEEFDEFEQQFNFDKKKSSKQVKRKWREIEAFKDRRREQRELASYDSYLLN